MVSQPINILVVNASSRTEGSVTRRLTKALLEKFKETGRTLNIVDRDLAHGMPFVDQEWIGANFTPANERSAEQAAALSYSDSLVEEMRAADLIIVGAPVYNFNVPASLKAWIDQIARVGLTFKYTQDGPIGLLEDKSAVVLGASGGTPFGSDIDFATGYLRHIFGFVGIEDFTLIGADALGAKSGDAIERAESDIAAFADDYVKRLRKAA